MGVLCGGGGCHSLQYQGGIGLISDQIKPHQTCQIKGYIAVTVCTSLTFHNPLPPSTRINAPLLFHTVPLYPFIFLLYSFIFNCIYSFFSYLLIFLHLISLKGFWPHTDIKTGTNPPCRQFAGTYQRCGLTWIKCNVICTEVLGAIEQSSSLKKCWGSAASIRNTPSG